MTPPDKDSVRSAWEKNAKWWSDYFGEGNDFHLQLVAPPVERLLEVGDGENILDVACGNGAFSRRLADLGARVVGFDFSSAFIECARKRSTEYKDRIDYRVVDATDRAQLLGLGKARFAAAVSNMALMDMSDIAVLAECLPRLLKPGGRFVFSIMHPCFNNNAVRLSIEDEQVDDQPLSVPSVRITKYLAAFESQGIGIVGQPVSQTYFHRPLNDLLRPFLSNGMAVTGLEETAFSDSSAARGPLSWDHFQEIPPVLVVRLKCC
ncbi:class I SAM-dependent methyltransferase [Candidatus Bipolaricaulota bacterium]